MGNGAFVWYVTYCLKIGAKGFSNRCRLTFFFHWSISLPPQAFDTFFLTLHIRIQKKILHFFFSTVLRLKTNQLLDFFSPRAYIKSNTYFKNLILIGYGIIFIQSKKSRFLPYISSITQTMEKLTSKIFHLQHSLRLGAFGTSHFLEDWTKLVSLVFWS